MFEFLLFVAACAVIAFLVTNTQKLVNQPKTKLQPIKIEREQKRRLAPRQKRPY
ncbi:hypothetical protein MUS1_08240 [Marinomonas ushuaiensis DSM 15871]|uniref:Uncharacterized protein n=1 Tax=Marinomonas ushuaiensis DSM 15871 TaxID=1122207 RepID=X7EA05_9GAMM|nr:hypothetical protein [Marinomonas ushuaiensis]ETX11943.1 hypothetical protein MUS1_08240 [Marinomonas ushuaiensis DSM 15871]